MEVLRCCRTSLSSVVRSRWKLIFEIFLKSFHRSRAVFALQIQRAKSRKKLLINSKGKTDKEQIVHTENWDFASIHRIEKEAQQISIFFK